MRFKVCIQHSLVFSRVIHGVRNSREPLMSVIITGWMQLFSACPFTCCNFCVFLCYYLKRMFIKDCLFPFLAFPSCFYFMHSLSFPVFCCCCCFSMQVTPYRCLLAFFLIPLPFCCSPLWHFPPCVLLRDIYDADLFSSKLKVKYTMLFIDLVQAN